VSIEITDEMVDRFRLNHDPANDLEQPDVRAGIAAVLAMPEVREAIHDDVRRETHEKLKAAGVTGYTLEWDR
jgi:hypothetical protein